MTLGEEMPPWADLLDAALNAAYRTMRLEGEERARAFAAAQRISDARMQAGRAVGRARRAGWDGNHLDLWKLAEDMAALGTIRHLPRRRFLEREYERWRKAHGGNES
jgi:hypothetical protein